MPRPARPAPAFVMIEPDRALGGCNTARNGPAGARDPHDLCHSGPVPGEDHLGGPRWGPADAAPDPPPAAPARLHGLCQGLPAPVLPAWPLRPRPGPAPCPSCRRQGGQDGVHLPWRRATPPVLVARDGQHRGLGTGLHPQAQAAVVPVDAIPRHPGGRDPSREGPSQPLLGQRRLRGHAPRLRNPGLAAALTSVGPRGGQRACTLQQGMAQRTRLPQQHPHLAMRHLTDRPTILTGDPGRVAAFFHQPGRVDHQHGFRLPQRLDPLTAPCLADGLGVPPGPAPPRLTGIGRGIAAHVRPWPAVLALGRTQQPSPRGPGPLARRAQRQAPGGAR